MEDIKEKYKNKKLDFTYIVLYDNKLYAKVNVSLFYGEDKIECLDYIVYKSKDVYALTKYYIKKETIEQRIKNQTSHSKERILKELEKDGGEKIPVIIKITRDYKYKLNKIEHNKEFNLINPHYEYKTNSIEYDNIVMI